MVEVEIEVELSPSEKDTSGASAAERHGVEDPAEDHVEAPPDQAGKRSSAPDSDSEELVPVESDPETEAGQVGRRCPAPDSDSEELVPAAPSRDEGARPGEEKASNSPEHSRTSACNASQLRPWTQQDTDLCKALTRVLRHRSNLKLDEAGYAKLTDVLVHPLTRRLKPTMDWIMYIVRANAKQRFALDEAGARIRAVQRHSIPVDSSQLLRRLESGDLGETVPTWALHSTYFSCIPSIMRHGLLPGGTRGTCYRRHVHLAMSYHPTAGLREGSDVILVIDLMRAHNAGCVFYVSDNNVILTADCIPPPCIARAQRTSTGEAYDLSKFRAAYKVVSAAFGLPVGVFLGLGHSTAWSLIPAQLALSPRCRCSSRSISGTQGLFGLAGSRQMNTRVGQNFSSCRCNDKVDAPIPSPATPGLSRSLASPMEGGLRVSGSLTPMAGHLGSVILALSRTVPWNTLRILPGDYSSSSDNMQRFFRTSTCQSIRPRCRRSSTSPNRGPKSALAPESRTSHQCQCRRQGVRVSSLSAGDEGLCKAQPIFPAVPGKPADGNHIQLRDVSYSSFAHTLKCAQPNVQLTPVGHRFRLWRFRYKLVRNYRRRKHRAPAPVVHHLEARLPPPRHRGKTEAREEQELHIAYPRRSGGLGYNRGLATLVAGLGFFPTTGRGALVNTPGTTVATSTSQPRKQAWIRAQQQASRHGQAWYRGRLVRSVMDPRTIVQSPPPRRSARRGPQHTKRGATARLQVMTLNVGHLSSFLWGEIKAQLGSPTCDHDVICLQELHWPQTCQFTVGGWTAVVSAGKDKSDGVMILVNPRYKPAQVKSDEIIKGRVLRVQITIDDSRVEIFGCYQFVWQSTLTKEDNLRRRQTLLDKLCVNVRAIAKRSTVVVLGDFNAELVPSPGRVGQSLANTPRHVGADAPDPTTLTRALEEMELIALNTWCTRSPHTNYTPTGCSQIDFVWVKDISADATARKCRPADPDVGSWRQMGHKQLTASIRLVKYYHLAKPQARAPGIDTTTLAEHARMHHPNTSLLRGRVQQGLEQLRGKPPAEALSQLNDVLHRATAETYPAHPRKQENRTSDYLPIWKLCDELRRHWRRDAAGLFQAWGAATRLAEC